jgi:hypothetical protein
VRLDRGGGAPELIAALAGLDRLDPEWVVAGNAGGTSDLRLVRGLYDPHGGSTDDRLPVRVVSLDENFLVFNRSRPPRCSPGLSGFHLYGTDVSLNASKERGAAYVIDMPLTHLSGGSMDSEYEAAKSAVRSSLAGEVSLRVRSNAERADLPQPVGCSSSSVRLESCPRVGARMGHRLSLRRDNEERRCGEMS